MLKPVIQEETTGCGIAAVANILWYWVVFQRVDGQGVVLDSASYLPSNVRTDFDAMQPKWFIEVKNT